jgi:photosynthetic reaction center cytochrome c subunit
MNFTATVSAAVGVAVAAVATGILVFSFERPPMQSTQQGYRGTAMVNVQNPRTLAKLAAANQVPEATPDPGPEGEKASEAYENVKVLGDLSTAQFTRLMASITEWVSPEQGCAYCHNVDNMASDEVYTKVVARRMLEMTKHINADWKAHVAATGVTCYTCHRGQPVPPNVWFANPGPRTPGGLPSTGQNLAATQVGLTSLPYDPFMKFLLKDESIRVTGTTALPSAHVVDLKQTEATYGLMMHMSSALGVNCTQCHNTRNFSSWAESSPQRVVAWHGIRMARDLNNAYLVPLTASFPAHRLGPTGDVAKINCATCHNGVNKPLNGVSMLSDYPELAK